MSTVTLTYNSNPLSTDVISVQDALTLTQLIKVDYSNSSLLGSSIAETIQLTVNYIQNAYNNTNLYVVTPNYLNNTITIQANNSNSTFTEVQNNTSGRITIGISNTPSSGNFVIDTITLSQADSDPCNNVKLTISTTPQASNITSPITEVVNTNPYIVDIQRVGETVVTMNDSNGNIDTKKLFIPSLVAADFTAEVLNAPNGGTVTVTNNYTKSLEGSFALEYSLNNTDWFLTNSFSGLAVGNYTIYVRDGIGCSFSLNFEIDEFSPTIDPRIAYTFVSNSGSFRFVKEVDFNTTIKTPYNTLSYQENVQNNNRFYKQPFENGDGIVQQQYKSSLETNQAFLIDCQGTETELTVTKKTQNLNREDVRDARVIATTYQDQNYVVVQYGSGNTYNPTTLEVNGTYSLGDELPDWIDIGEYLNIQNAGWFKVLDIVRIEGVNSAILSVLESSYPETIPQQGLSRRVISIFNQLDYEVYEFNVDMTNLSGDYRLKISSSDSEFDTEVWNSEWFNVAQSQPKTHFVKWYNTKNNEINYSTGIVNKARFKYIYKPQWLPNNAQETFVANTDTIQIESTVRNFYQFKLMPIPTGMNQKFNLICANDRVFIDGINYVRETEPEVTYYNSTNLYQTNQQLTEANYKFDNNRSDGSIDLDGGSPLGIEDLGTGLLYVE